MSNIIPITNLNIPELEIYTNYTDAQLVHIYEPDMGVFICESPRVIERAFNAGYTPLSILLDEAELKEDVLELISRCGDIPVYTASKEILSQLRGYNLTRGMLCAMRRKDFPSVKSIIENARRIAVMEDVLNPTNVGAIFRSAAALNMDAILLTPGSSDPLYRRAARVSMGTVFQAPWTYIPEEITAFHSSPDTEAQNQDSQTYSYIEYLQQLGFKTVAFALRDDSISIDAPELAAEEKLAIILGTEGDGLKDSTLSACDYTVKIPMSHGVDSLNVAAASAVAFWELSK